MTVENISWSISMKACCRPGGGRNRNLLITSRTRIQLSHRRRRLVCCLSCFICSSSWCHYKAIFCDCDSPRTSSILFLTHCSLETPKRVIGKQCRPRSDAAECGVWSASALFANDSSTIFLYESHCLTYLKSKSFFFQYFVWQSSFSLQWGKSNRTEIHPLIGSTQHLFAEYTLFGQASRHNI